MPDDADTFEHVVALYNHVLPNIGKPFLRKYLGRDKVQTLLMLLPEDSPPHVRTSRAAGSFAPPPGARSPPPTEEARRLSVLGEEGRRAEEKHQKQQPEEAEVGVGPSAPAAHLPSGTFRDLGFHDGGEGEAGEEDDEEDENEEEESEGGEEEEETVAAEARAPPPAELSRIVGVLSFEALSRFGQEIVQVFFFGVDECWSQQHRTIGKRSYPRKLTPPLDRERRVG